MDRALSKGPIGLVIAWLDAAENCKASHDVQKAILSDESMFDTRCRARQASTRIAEEQKGVYQECLDLEENLRGTKEEPRKLACTLR